MMGDPLSVAGGAHDTVAEPLPAVAAPIVGGGVPTVIGRLTFEMRL
jgi:hypothetical protein